MALADKPLHQQSKWFPYLVSMANTSLFFNSVFSSGVYARSTLHLVSSSNIQETHIIAYFIFWSLNPLYPHRIGINIQKIASKIVEMV